MSIMIDLTFLDKPKYLWDKEIVDKMDSTLKLFRESQTDQSVEECFLTFCLDYQGAKADFINKLRELPLIMKCRTKADAEFNFGGQQCAKFTDKIRETSDKYLNSSIYTKDNSITSIPFMIKRMREKAIKDKQSALDFEEKTRMNYLSTGKDNTLEIFSKSGYNISKIT